MAETVAPTLRLVTFHPAWGLATSCPFGLKLEACLRKLEVRCEPAIGIDNRKGLKSKSAGVGASARSMDNLVAFVARGLARWFPEHPAALRSTTGVRSAA
jgi:hypothetical protein